MDNAGMATPYNQIHFRINSGYMRDDWDKKKPVFYEEITRLFTQNGWGIAKERSTGRGPTVRKERTSLYIHPNDVSGPVHEMFVPEIERILSEGETFKYYKTDIYSPLYDLDDLEYKKYLEDKTPQIREMLLDIFTTKRSNLYVLPSEALFKVGIGIRLKRVEGKNVVHSSGDPEQVAVERVFNKMVEEGCFASAEVKYGIGYRTKKVG